MKKPRMVAIPTGLPAKHAVAFYALAVLRANGGNRLKAAKDLKVQPSTLRAWLNLLRKEGVEVPPALRPGNPKPKALPLAG